ncbi:hypothetical protein SH661x_002166 [Planctomicrobium sp. SH661]|uniref:hypothetical protein n=1 Tax=Planctomicrobium sp. SH661 TaxID=3448124 RepID=UPI003F5C3598
MNLPRWIAGSVLVFLAVAWLLTVLISGVGSSLFNEWSLVFQRGETTLNFIGLLLLAAACVAAMAALFRYEQQLISPKLGIVLLSLRMGLVLIIFLTLLQPVWTWTYDRTTSKRLLLALDVSESMDTIDRQASQAEKIRWAEAIGILGSPEARARAKSWISSLQSGHEPEWVSPKEEASFEKRKQLIQVRQENLQSQLKELEQLSRLEILRRACALHPDSPLDELQKLTTLQLSAFARSTVPIQADELKSTEDLTNLDVGRSHSNLAEATVAAREGNATAPLAGVILLSDGHDTDSPAAAQLVSRLQGLNVPVHTVLVGSEHRPRDLSVIHIDHPESVFLKDQPLVKTILQTAGFEGESVNVLLDDLDHPDRAPLKKTITPQSPTSEVSFSLADLPVGRHRFRVRAEIAPNETREDNNSEDFSISVVDDRARILLIEGESRWEFRFLDAALNRDEQISVDHVVFEQPFLRVLQQPFFPSSLEELETARDGETPFAAYDLVLIGDVSPQNLTAQRWQQLERYVRDEGGTLVLTAGKRFFPMAYRGTLAESLLPIQDLREVRLEDASQTGPPATRGFRLSISPDGEQVPMFQLDSDPAKARKIWSGLPGHLWGIVGTARGGATVWASALKPGERASLENERLNALIVQQHLGSGQVIWIGLESTWRWRYLVGDLYHHRFWGQLIRWAVSFKAAAGNDAVKVGLREPVIRTGQPAVIQARWDPRFLARHSDPDAEAIFERRGDGPPVTQTIPLTPRPGNSLLYEGQALNLPAGEYTVRLKSKAAEPGLELPEVVLIVNAELTPELQDVSANRALLEQIATSTGGKFLYVNELDQLPPFFKSANETERVREEIPLYGHWVILVLFSGIAMTEWVLRKVNGLP